MNCVYVRHIRNPDRYRRTAIDGLTGFVVPPGSIERFSSAILKLLNDSTLYLRMGANPRKRIEDQFDVRKT